MKKNNLAFKESHSSIFIINSPFQAICAIEAINKFKIEKYKILLNLIKDKRNEQLFNLLKKYNIAYSTNIDESISKFDKIKLLFKKGGEYKRAFIGNYANLTSYYYALLYVQSNSSIVYLDDGNSSLRFLDDKCHFTGKTKISFSFYKMMMKIRNIKYHNFFTIYDNRPSNKYNIVINNLDILKNSKPRSEMKNIYIIGTNCYRYCEAAILPIDYFKKSIKNSFAKIKLKYPNQKIYYIPHGRDTSTFPKEFCDQFGFIFHEVEMTVEIYLLSLDYTPLGIYGYSSTALFNLRKIFPNSDICNLIIPLKKDSPSYDYMNQITDYFVNHNIRKIEI